MEDAVWLAKIFGPLLTLLGLWIVCKTDEVHNFWVSMKMTPSSFYLSGVINFLVGCAILSVYSMWSMHLAVLVTLFGYLQVLRGILVFFWHDGMLKLTNKLAKHHQLRYLGFIPLVWGVALLYLGFYCCM